MSVVESFMSAREADRRAAIRVPVHAPCVAHRAGAAACEGLSVRVRDASLGGVCLEWPGAGLPLNRVVYLQLDPRDAAGRAYAVRATVIRSDRRGVALEFDRMRPSAMSRLLQLSGDQRERKTMKRTDEELAAAVVRALKDDARLAGAEPGVCVEDGVACLSGTVGTWGAKMAAQEAARGVRGIAGVRNGIEFPVGEGARLTDNDVSRAVRVALERDLLVPEARVSFTVSAGWVTLEGAVDHWKQRGDLERAVRKLPGVLGVANKVEFRAMESRPEQRPYSGGAA